jgi:hypothetical protein
MGGIISGFHGCDSSAMWQALGKGVAEMNLVHKLSKFAAAATPSAGSGPCRQAEVPPHAVAVLRAALAPARPEQTARACE